MNTPRARAIGALWMAACVATIGNCVVVSSGDWRQRNHGGHLEPRYEDTCSDCADSGDVRFAWSFEGETSCDLAGVDMVDVRLQGLDVDDYQVGPVPCEVGEIAYYDFVPGRYRLVVTGMDWDGIVRYEQQLTLAVRGGGLVADLGLVDLDAVVAQPQVRTGAVALDWAFRYPVDDAVFDCAYAGVRGVWVQVDDALGVTRYAEELSCQAGPVSLEGFEPGAYAVTLFGVGAYGNQDIDLYTADPIELTISAGLTTDIGVVTLERLGESFADVALDWDFGGLGCSAEGVRQVSVDILREDGQILDDGFDVDCDDPQLRETFVPGAYLVELWADDLYGGCWYAAAAVDLAPGRLVAVELRAYLVACED